MLARLKNSLCLNEFRKNLAANLDRFPLIHSYCYESAGDQSTLFAIFPLSFVPSCNMRINHREQQEKMIWVKMVFLLWSKRQLWEQLFRRW
jgi:hypothetical protein